MEGSSETISDPSCESSSTLLAWFDLSLGDNCSLTRRLQSHVKTAEGGERVSRACLRQADVQRISLGSKLDPARSYCDRNTCYP